MRKLADLYDENLPLLTGMIAAIVVLIIAAAWLARHLYKTSDSRKIKRLIKKHGVAYEHDVVFSNGVGGYFFIDYLILLPSCILALNLQSLRGYVFGGENIELWTQVERNRSAKFRNPLDELKLFVKHATDQLKFDGMMARVLFDSKATFPKGVPENVLQLATFSDNLAALAGTQPPAEATTKVWGRLLNLIAESRTRYARDTV